MGVEHYIVNPVGSVSAKTCNGWLKWFINLAKVNPHVMVDAVPMIDVLGYDYPLAQDAQRRRNGSGVSSSPLSARR